MIEPQYICQCEPDKIYEKFLAQLRQQRVLFRTKEDHLYPVDQPAFEKPVGYYERIFANRRKNKHPAIRPYHHVCVDLYTKYQALPDGAEEILELGAGLGSFMGLLLRRHKPKQYLACEWTKIGSQSILDKIDELGDNAEHVQVQRIDIKSVSDIGEFTCLVALEVLEHVAYDINLIRQVKPGAMILMSLPLKFGTCHVRAFPEHHAIWQRYRDLIDLKEIVPVWKLNNTREKGPPKWWCCVGFRR
jgi:hypothetical protein